MTHEFTYQHRVEFAETDLAGIVHFANYFRYMENAEHAFLRSLGISVHGEIDGQTVSFPRVKAECTFKAPLAFEDVVLVHLTVREKARKTVTYAFRLEKEDGTLVALGSVTAVCVVMDRATGRMAAVSIPAAIDRKIEAAPALEGTAPPRSPAG
jgi:acyl-CoA thioester hydrolase